MRTVLNLSDATLAGLSTVALTAAALGTVRVRRWLHQRRTRAAERQRLQRMDALALLTGSLAHRFNNLMVEILGNAQWITDHHQKLPLQLQAPLRRLSSATARAATLCGELLEITSGGTGTAREFDLRQVLRAALPQTQGDAKVGSIRAELPPEPLLLFGDEQALLGMVQHFLRNATEASAGRGSITMSLARQRPPCKSQERTIGEWFGVLENDRALCASITFADRGTGMSPEQVQHIFDPFYSTRFPGRGTGLALAFAVLRRHRGIVQVKSNQDQGTQFTLYLPLQPAQPDQRVAAPAQLAAPRRVLVVDDEPGVRGMTERTLQQLGVEVIAAASGGDALNQLAKLTGDVHAAVIDYNMPDMDGSELSRQLAKRHPDLPLVLMSGLDQALVQANCPPCEFLAKPFLRDELVAALARATSRSIAGVS